MRYAVIFRYAVHYTASYMAFWTVIMVATILTDNKNIWMLGFMILTGAAVATGARFVIDERRLPKRREYWTLVLGSTVLAILLEFLTNFLSSYLTAPSLPSAGVWYAIALIGAVGGLLFNMIGYSRLALSPIRNLIG